MDVASRKRYLAATVGLAAVFCLLVVYRLDTEDMTVLYVQMENEMERVLESIDNNDDVDVEPPLCKFPQLQVDDPLIAPFLTTYPKLKCDPKPNWVYTDNGRFYIKRDAEAKHGRIRCEYGRIDRVDDSNYAETHLGAFRNGTLLDGDAFVARCVAADGQKYFNIHTSVPLPKGPLLDRVQLPTPPETSKLNVLIYLMDSVSRINFLRKLPNFYRLLTQTMGARVMEGFNVVGDGTPWALIPMLTGHFQTELPEARRRFTNSSFLDDWPFVFKDYAAAGYVTSYAEEQPWYSAFTYKIRGFNATPVDHYLRPMLLAVDKNEKLFQRFCLGDAPRSLAWLDHWQQLQTVYRPYGNRQLSVMFSSETSHDDYNLVQTLDEHWTEAFGRLYTSGYFNDTLLVVMADHGRRFGAVRQTQSGKLEEKLPFLAVVPPPQFQQRFPNADANLRRNRRRLVTVFDLHATLKHMLNFTEDVAVDDDDEQRNEKNGRAISLFRRISPNRTCAQADIKAHFCSCLEWSHVAENDSVALAGAESLVESFNRQLVEVNGTCAPLKVGRIISARRLAPNGNLLGFKESIDIDNITPDLTADRNITAALYQIRFITEPGGGDWEASMSYFTRERAFRVSPDDVSRLNAYHDQAICVIKTHQHLRTFCYCRS